jgi:hypothetical protein
VDEALQRRIHAGALAKGTPARRVAALSGAPRATPRPS